MASPAAPASQLVFIEPSPRLAVEVAGTGPFVLFLHGIGGSRAQWRPQLDSLVDRFTVAAWDARGYGASEDYVGELQFDQFADDVLRVLDHFKVERAHLVGLSMGGRIAREFALRWPDRVAKLVLANTTPGFAALTPEAARDFIAARAAPLRAGKSLDELARDLVPRLLHPQASAAARDAAYAMMRTLHAASYIKTVEASVTQDRAAPIELVRAPTLVITSDTDRLYPPEIAIGMARRIPNAQLITIAQAGHLSNLEQPDAFNQAVRKFLVT
jgi:3-oxoadipate enol-lactonase